MGEGRRRSGAGMTRGMGDKHSDGASCCALGNSVMQVLCLGGQRSPPELCVLPGAPELQAVGDGCPAGAVLRHHAAAAVVQGGGNQLLHVGGVQHRGVHAQLAGRVEDLAQRVHGGLVARIAGVGAPLDLHTG